MARVIPCAVTFAMALTEMALLTMVAGCGIDGDSNQNPKPCCFPEQFTAVVSDLTPRVWANMTYDFANSRKFVSYLDDDDFFFYYTDFATGVIYEHRGGVCRYYSKPGIFRTFLSFPCIPDDAVLVSEGGSLGGNTWKIHSNKMSGFITVDQDKCYPIAYSLSDTDSGFGYKAFLTNINEGIDPEVFNVDLSQCVPV